ncbi:hypothetical protein J2W28_004488 [Variovorax boronicumulans]|uniref:HNH endonuclease n=1 Tax=Variovorax boronicumulans TaxID=436515 RepID=UPI002784D323|nr:HNH endonuclease signature motif containing protein [Variovorax boronicumulans]MDP9993809.1 hypothetical protein [Variovorax boronicumulans]MDQ0005326.1 hypothetical protein [Variovorax boronicumulans]
MAQHVEWDPPSHTVTGGKGGRALVNAHDHPGDVATVSVVERRGVSTSELARMACRPGGFWRRRLRIEPAQLGLIVARRASRVPHSRRSGANGRPIFLCDFPENRTIVSPNFSIGSNEAYSRLGTHPPGQGWFAFDKLMPDARKGKATKFAMTVWNLRDPERANLPQPIRQDTTTGDYWYRVPRTRDGEDPKKRTSLWNGVRIAQENQLPMIAILKDRDTHQCSLDHVFDITDVRYELDGAAFWLRLDPGTGDIGTEVEMSALAYLLDLPTSLQGAVAVVGNQEKSRRLLTLEEYEAVCEVAAQVHQGVLSRKDGIAQLVAESGINGGTAGALLNNYRCLTTGTEIRSPMSAEGMLQFTDSVVALDGAQSLPNVIAAVEGFIGYAKVQWKSDAREMRKLVQQLRADWMAFVSEDAIADAIKKAEPDAEHGASDRVSEILREVWVRGPQHAAFRRALMRRWGKACSVHEATCNGHLRASHIVAWSLDKDRRGDPDNGLLLSVPLDSLFDRGLIAFDDEGNLLRSRLLSADTVNHFGVQPGLRLLWANLGKGTRERIRANLARHRAFHAAEHEYIS